MDVRGIGPRLEQRLDPVGDRRVELGDQGLRRPLLRAADAVHRDAEDQ